MANTPSSFSFFVLTHQFFFLLSGLVQTLGAQWLYYQGAASGFAFTTSAVQYFGQMSVGLLLPFLIPKHSAYQPLASSSEAEMTNLHKSSAADDPDEKEVSIKHGAEGGPLNHKALIKIATLDVVANFLITIGFFYIGSGLYQVIYSSVVIWCAILSYIFLGRKLQQTQWITIFGTSAGLTVSALGGRGLDGGNAESAATFLFGMGLTTFATFLYACIYTLSDHLLTPTTTNIPPHPARICTYVGLYTFMYAVAWLLIYTYPRVGELLHPNPMTATWQLCAAYLALVIASLVHSLNYFVLIERTGSVSTGVLQGLRAILVFILSAYFFCDTDEAQCFTVWKGAGGILVVGCVVWFSVIGGRGRH